MARGDRNLFEGVHNMKRLMMSVVVVSLLLLGHENGFATSDKTFASLYPTLTIDNATKQAINAGQSLQDVLTDAVAEEVNIDETWNLFVSGATQSGMTGLEIWNVLVTFVSPETDISSVSQSSP